MNVLILDAETTVERVDGRIDGSPKNPRNKMVMCQYGWMGLWTVDTVHVDTFYHKECTEPANTDRLIKHLTHADVLVCHNAKFDVEWLMEMGLPIPPKIYCTMIGEYVLARGRRNELSLKKTALRRKTKSFKKSDLIDEKFKAGMCFSEIPLDDVIEYGIADVMACGEIYHAQLQDFKKEGNESLLTVTDFMNQMLEFLCEIEMNGVKIDLDVLDTVEKEFRAEKDALTTRLNEIVVEVMGDTPINLQSGADMTMVIYSRKVKNRDAHIQTFNIGTNEAGKSLMPPRMTQKQFVNAVRTTTEVVQRTIAVQCPDCSGVGSTQKFKQVTKVRQGKKYRMQGDPYKNRTNCKVCKASGAIYRATGVVAGLKLNPSLPRDASILGFKTDKGSIQTLVKQAEAKGNAEAAEFLTKLR